MADHALSFTRYLAAKTTVDDRALNHHVWRTLRAALPTTTPRVLELGAGIGTMAERLTARGLLTGGTYLALDEQAENIAAARARLAALRGPVLDLRVAEAQAFCAQPEHHGQFDLLIAHAFLDLLDPARAVPALLKVLKPGGLFYFTINFDGGTIFQPEIDPVYDAHLEALYHRTMDERVTAGQPSGDSRTGRHLFSILPAAGAEVLAAGSSDWTVFAPGPSPRRYPADEAYFLWFILRTWHSALCHHPEVEPERFQAWMATRYAQLERGELVYIAHQLDFCGRWGAGA